MVKGFEVAQKHSISGMHGLDLGFQVGLRLMDDLLIKELFDLPVRQADHLRQDVCCVLADRR